MFSPVVVYLGRFFIIITEAEQIKLNNEVGGAGMWEQSGSSWRKGKNMIKI